MPLPPLVKRLTDSSRPERAVLLAAALGLLTLIDPAKLSAGKRFGYRMGLGAGTAALILADASVPLSPLNKLSLATAAGGITTGSAELGEKLDAAVQRKLRSAGVSRPRVVMAVATALCSLLPDLAAIRRARNEERLAAVGNPVSASDHEGAGAEQLLALPASVSALIARMLGDEELWGAAELRAQLNTAQEPLAPGDRSGEYGTYLLRVDESLPLAVPHTFDFPVTAHVTDSAGEERTVTLTVVEGKLGSLFISATESGEEGWPAPWPMDSAWEFRPQTATSRQ